MFIPYLLLIAQSMLAEVAEPRMVAMTEHSIDYHIDISDSLTAGQIEYFGDRYPENGIFTFRQNHHRNPIAGRSELSKLSEIVVDWTFTTASDTVSTPSFGPWYGGTGWTGQPLYVEWTDDQVRSFEEQSVMLTSSFSNKELIIGSLCGEVYFIDFQTGAKSRQPIKVGNPIKGTPSLDPDLNGNLYVGHGIPKRDLFGFSVYDIFSHREIHRQGRDAKAHRAWGAFDSSPVVVGQFLFWPAENGSLYKFNRGERGVTPHSVLRYNIAGSWSLGIENSMAVHRNYGYFGDNGGSVICVNLSTLAPVWIYDNRDDIDATIVIDTTERWTYLYVGSEVDKQGIEGEATLTKLNAITGVEVWQHREQCHKKIFAGGKMLDGGVFGTPLLGVGDCEELLFVSYAANRKEYGGLIVAFDKASGRVVNRIEMDNYLWSSPVAICDNSGRMYIFTADTDGYAYLIEGRSGSIIDKKKVGANFESSPIVVGNSIVIGSRGSEIYKLSLR